MSFTCPACQRTSHNPSDEKHRYCGYCNRFWQGISEPVLEGDAMGWREIAAPDESRLIEIDRVVLNHGAERRYFYEPEQRAVVTRDDVRGHVFWATRGLDSVTSPL